MLARPSRLHRVRRRKKRDIVLFKVHAQKVDERLPLPAEKVS